jgi:hypothetical protein
LDVVFGRVHLINVLQPGVAALSFAVLLQSLEKRRKKITVSIDRNTIDEIDFFW